MYTCPKDILKTFRTLFIINNVPLVSIKVEESAIEKIAQFTPLNQALIAKFSGNRYFCHSPRMIRGLLKSRLRL